MSLKIQKMTANIPCPYYFLSRIEKNKGSMVAIKAFEKVMKTNYFDPSIICIFCIRMENICRGIEC